jgi:phenylalanyl-tRNA synthetase beta chain
MTISYKWLSEYLPVDIEPERLSRILTSIGLEVESLSWYQEVKGGLKGLVVGDILSVDRHPNADKLTLTQVDIGRSEPLQIVCGAPNVSQGQKVLVAPVGTTIYPTNGEPITMKSVSIRNVESQGMICAEDEIGLGTDHSGIIVLPENLKPGTAAAEYFQPYEDWIFEIGLTPNRMDAMSHWGVARDVCAYLSHHDKKEYRPKLPSVNGFKAASNSFAIDVAVENTLACPRYSGVSISNVEIKESPRWLQQKLRAIGLRPINNLVDITNFIQHETGQPLHAFDADQLSGKKIIVKNLPAGTKFITLDEKERTLNADDLMICDAKGGICIAGVFGGLHSGVTGSTRNIFLESACFDPVSIRKTSFSHGLRTDAASRFEKGTDISATVPVLKRAALLITEICGGSISSEIVDVYPDPKPRTEVAVKYHYLKKLSGKNFHPDTVRNILTNLGFNILKEGIDELRVEAPYHKPDIHLPADLAEEILRIDGLDNVEIPGSITITPSIEENYFSESLKEKISNYLAGIGFNEILTNSITNSAYFREDEKETMVKMMNSLSATLDIMRSSLFETSLEVIAHNLNRRNNLLHLFEFGKAYGMSAEGKYCETMHLALVVSGPVSEDHWKQKAVQTDVFYLKGVIQAIFEQIGISYEQDFTGKDSRMDRYFEFRSNNQIIARAGEISKRSLDVFDIKQPVFFAEFEWDVLTGMAAGGVSGFREIARFPAVQRDLAIVVPNNLSWEKVEQTVQKIRLDKLQSIKLFDIFESEKLGAGKKSMALSFVFQDNEKTLTDKEIDSWMTRIMGKLEEDLQAGIRK